MKIDDLNDQNSVAKFIDGAKGYIVPKGAKPSDYDDNHERALVLALDMHIIRAKTKGPREFAKKCYKYFKARPMMMEPGISDPMEQAKKMTIISVIGDIITSCCEIARIDTEHINMALDDECRFALVIDNHHVSKAKAKVINQLVDIGIKQCGFKKSRKRHISRNKLVFDKNYDDDMFAGYDIDEDIMGEA